MNRKMVIGAVGLAVLVTGWALFRPERLFVNQKVNESLTMTTASAGDANAMSSMSAATEPRVLAMGMFHNGSHETAGTASIYQMPDGKRVLRLSGFHTSNG